MNPIIQTPMGPMVANQQPNQSRGGKNNNKGGRPNYFDRQKQKSGGNDSWLQKTRQEQLERDVPNIVRDIIFGNIKPEDVYTYFLCNQSVNYAMRKATYDKLTEYTFRCNCDDAYKAQKIQKGEPITDIESGFMNEDNIMCAVWSSMQQFLTYLAGISQSDPTGQVSVNYFMAQFQPYMNDKFKAWISFVK